MDKEYPELPDFIKELLESGAEIDEIRLDAEGNWLHDGQPFTNKKIIDFFNRSVDVTRDGKYVLHYSDFVYPIVVEDAPYFITGVRFEGFGSFETIYITLSTGEEEELDINSLYYKSNNSLYCYVREGRLPAKFKRSPSFQILERLEETDDTYYLKIQGKRIVLQEKMD